MATTTSLKKIIEQSQISVSKIATDTGIERTTLYRWIAQNRIPKAENRQELANVLKVSVESIPGGDVVNGALPIATFGSLEEIPNETWIELLDNAQFLDVYSSGTASVFLKASSEVQDTLRYRMSREGLKVRVVIADPSNQHSIARLDGFKERASKTLEGWNDALHKDGGEVRTHNLPMGAATFNFGHRAIVTNRFNAEPVAQITAALLDSGHPSWQAVNSQFEFAYGQSQPAANE